MATNQSPNDPDALLSLQGLAFPRRSAPQGRGVASAPILRQLQPVVLLHRVVPAHPESFVSAPSSLPKPSRAEVLSAALSGSPYRFRSRVGHRAGPGGALFIPLPASLRAPAPPGRGSPRRPLALPPCQVEVSPLAIVSPPYFWLGG